MVGRQQHRWPQLASARTAWYDPLVQSIKVSSKRQITIPSAACRRLGIAAGDRLTVEIRDDALVLHRRPATAFERLWGLGADAWEGVDPVAFTRGLRDEFEDGPGDDR